VATSCNTVTSRTVSAVAELIVWYSRHISGMFQ